MSIYSQELQDFRKSQFKKGLNPSEQREKRRNDATSLRKNRREERLKQSRKDTVNNFETNKLSDINPNDLNSQDPAIVLKCLKQIRKA
ncbi:MAG: hypothetical protein KGD67_12290, partial [Candidatus Lokiarchaeota archaeon]|nr:hypothetical protein [Candidatus Lokiarchaeota archaeon]